MIRRHLLKIIDDYDNLWLSPQRSAPCFPGMDEAEERQILREIRDFVSQHPDCFERSCPTGHITGSALVVSPDLDRVLLTLHRKLNAWLQLGGHSDGHAVPHEVALREAREESGLADLRFVPFAAALGVASYPDGPLPFDFDYHFIPARPGEPAHIHYDIRFLIAANPHEPLVITEESRDLRWFTLPEARAVAADRSMTRQFDKLAWLREKVSDSYFADLTAKSPTLP